MNMFSKFFSGECTRFLFSLIVFLSFNGNCFAENGASLKEYESKVKAVVSESNNMETKQSNSEKTAEQSPAQETSDKKSSEAAIAEFMKGLFGVKISDAQKPFKDYPGYWTQLINFDVEITNVEANDEFPSESFHLKDLKGNVVILFFTATWCPNCVKVFQDLDKLVKELDGKNISNVKIVTLVLGTESDNDVKNYYEKNKVKSLRRFKSISPLFFNMVRAIPTCFVFDKKSVLIWGFSGAANYGDPHFLNFIEGLSKEDIK